MAPEEDWGKGMGLEGSRQGKQGARPAWPVIHSQGNVDRVRDAWRSVQGQGAVQAFMEAGEGMKGIAVRVRLAGMRAGKRTSAAPPGSER